jgi:hypothetical protein
MYCVILYTSVPVFFFKQQATEYLESDRILMQIVPKKVIVEPVGIFAIVLLISEALSRSTKRLTSTAFTLGFSTSIIIGQLTTLVADCEPH